MSRQYIYQIERLTKKHGQREVLKDIWLSFYPGAKIGVLGRNGSGKSTLLRIMAGMDKDFDGEAAPDRRLHRRATCRKSRSSTAEKDVWGNVQEAVAPRRKMLDRYNEISDQARRAAGRRRDGEAVRRDGPSAGPDRSDRTPGSSTASSKSRWTR